MASRSLRSSAPKGSSIRRTLGPNASARASATRCCWPPLNSRGYRRSMPASLTRSRSSITRLWAKEPDCPRSRRPKPMFSATVICGNSASPETPYRHYALCRREGDTSSSSAPGCVRRSDARSRQATARPWSCRSRKGRAAREILPRPHRDRNHPALPCPEFLETFSKRILDMLVHAPMRAANEPWCGSTCR